MPTAIYKHGFGSTPFLTVNGLTLGRTELGFNTLEARYYGSTNEPVSYSNLHFPQGFPLTGYTNMYVADVQMAQESADVWLFTVQAKGLLGLQAVKRTITTKTQSYTTGPVTIPGIGAVAQGQGSYINLSCTFNYISYTLPALDVEPQNAVVPAGASLPIAPANPFSTNISAPNYTASPIYNYPYGWLREGIEVDNVNGAEVYMVKEEWVYKYQFMPG
jgi:hypothetical protein